VFAPIGVGKWHLYAHVPSCRPRNSPTRITEAGWVDGEAVERLWARLVKVRQHYCILFPLIWISINHQMKPSLRYCSKWYWYFSINQRFLEVNADKHNKQPTTFRKRQTSVKNKLRQLRATRMTLLWRLESDHNYSQNQCEAKYQSYIESRDEPGRIRVQPEPEHILDLSAASEDTKLLAGIN
jgi:hypothetical protein